jgi:hypothetical protein
LNALAERTCFSQVCGGKDCGGHPGGHAGCCTKQVVAAGNSCSVH